MIRIYKSPPPPPPAVSKGDWVFEFTIPDVVFISIIIYFAGMAFVFSFLFLYMFIIIVTEMVKWELWINELVKEFKK